MAPKRGTPVPSRTFSCSELKEGQKHLKEVKQEKLSMSDLEKQIKEPKCDENWCKFIFIIMGHHSHETWEVRHGFPQQPQ